MNKIFKQTAAVLCAVLTVLGGLLSAQTARAGETYESAQTLTEGADTSVTLTSGNTSWYKFTMDKTGYAELVITSVKAPDLRIMVYDQGMNLIYDENTDSHDVFKTEKYGIKPGTIYYIKLYSYKSDPVTFTIKAVTTAATDWEQEPNNSFNDATELAAGVETHANLTRVKDNDFYSFVLPDNGTVSFRCEFEYNIFGLGLQVFDKDKNRLYSDSTFKDGGITSDAVSGKKGDIFYALTTYGPKNYTITAVFTPVTAPARVTGLNLKRLKDGKIRVIYSKVPEAAGYQVQYTYGTKTKNVTVKGTTTTKLSVPKGTKTTVRVRAYKSNGKARIYGKWSVKKSLK